MAELRESFTVSARHPSLPGHFPGAPIVPGVVLLDHVAGCLQRAGAGDIARLLAVKFMAPLLPEQHARMHIEVTARRARFRIVRADVIILAGDAELR
ncbi:MAG: hydroxymyristoyl-ACP dehydratase [Dokdonella sp.]